MRTINRRQILDLLENPDPPCLSIFMPTHRAGRETQQDPIRLKNLLKEAHDLLAERYPEGPPPETLLAEAQALLDDRPFWQHQEDGLAIFSNPQETILSRLPYRFESRVSVGENFNIVPLLPLLVRDGPFYLLAIDLGGSQLFEGTQMGMSEAGLPETPLSLEAALRYDDPETELQFHSGSSPARGNRDAMYFGTGAGAEDDRSNEQRFLQQLAAGVQSTLGSQTAPLVLAGVERLVAAYREINRYPHLVEGFVPGSPGETPIQELHPRAWELVEPVFTAEKTSALERYASLRGTGSVSAHLDEILPAAAHGQVDTLFLKDGGRVWGSFDPQRQVLEVHPRQQAASRDLLGWAARQTITQGGLVYLLDARRMPDEANAAAILRYPLKR